MESILSLENRQFAVYLAAVALVVLKQLGQSWFTVVQMAKHNGGFLNPEDLKKSAANPKPHDKQLQPIAVVERSRRIELNDSHNISPFCIVGLLFLFTSPSDLAIYMTMGGFVAARLGHTWAYHSAQLHDIRATFFSVGSLITIYMCIRIILAAFT